MNKDMELIFFMKRRVFAAIIVMISFCLISCNNNDSSNTENDNNSVKQSDTKKSDNTNKKQDVNNKNEDTSSKKKIYLEKLETIQAGLKDLESLYAGNTAQMNAAAEKEYQRWDAALNEIYGVLKTQLSKEEMSKLQTEEIQWIKDKEAKGNAAAEEMKGGTGASFQYLATIAGVTKDRCYQLVNQYMK